MIEVLERGETGSLTKTTDPDTGVIRLVANLPKMSAGYEVVLTPVGGLMVEGSGETELNSVASDDFWVASWLGGGRTMALQGEGQGWLEPSYVAEKMGVNQRDALGLTWAIAKGLGRPTSVDLGSRQRRAR